MADQLSGGEPIVHENLTMVKRFRDFLNSLERAELITYKLIATDNAGDGTVEGDVNATDFIGQGQPAATTTNKFIDRLDVVIIEHMAINYMYSGIRIESIGIGGTRVTVATDFISI